MNIFGLIKILAIFEIVILFLLFLIIIFIRLYLLGWKNYRRIFNNNCYNFGIWKSLDKTVIIDDVDTASLELEKAIYNEIVARSVVKIYSRQSGFKRDTYQSYF